MAKLLSFLTARSNPSSGVQVATLSRCYGSRRSFRFTSRAPAIEVIARSEFPPPSNGTIFRIVEFPPTKPADGHVDHDRILKAMGIDPATQGYMRHANTHRTKSIDYALVIDGEIDMLLDETQVHMKAGDTLVQQGTNHAWVNNSGRNCRVAFVLIDASTPPAWAKGWKP